MVGLRILFTALAWLVWWGGLVLILPMDRREHPEQSIAPYVLLGLFLGGWVPPIYFWITRRTFVAVLHGIGLAFALSLVAGFISFVGRMATSGS